MLNTQKLGTILLTSVLIIGLSGCGNQNKAQAPQNSNNAAAVTKQTQPKVGQRALKMAEEKAAEGLKIYLDNYKGMNNKWANFIKTIEIKFNPQNYIKINTTAENNEANIKILQTAVPIIKTWATNNCKIKFEYLELTDKQGAVLIKEKLN